MRNFYLLPCFLVLGAAAFSDPALAQKTPSPIFLHQISTAYNSQLKVPASLSLSGSAIWTAGSKQESGSILEVVTSDGATTETWTFPTVSHTEAKSAVDFSGLSRICSYSDAHNKKHDVLGRNCMHGVPWFSPSFVLSQVIEASMTVEDRTSEADFTQGLVRLTYLPSSGLTGGISQDEADLLQTIRKGIAVTVVYDAQTALPKRLEFQQSTDADDAASIDIAVAFSDYRSEDGFMVPHHIKRYLQRTLVLDFIVTNVSIQ